MPKIDFKSAAIGAGVLYFFLHYMASKAVAQPTTSP
jgi:hypothetical protein